MEASGGLSVGKVCVVPLDHTSLADISPAASTYP